MFHKELRYYFFTCLKQISNLIVLEIAQNVGIKIPDTFIEFEKEQDKQTDSYITKAISDGPFWTAKNHVLNYKTYSLDNEKYENQNSMFFPTLMQNKIEKLFELRIFYLNGKFYSMAIFSQENDKTKIDFRNYDKGNPNRYIPFKLPRKEKNKLDLLMKKLELNTGSIDMIYSTSNEFVFLEVNPVGQYDMVSSPCNYYLHKTIAETLISIKEQIHV